MSGDSHNTDCDPDITFTPDIRGSSLLVRWRKVPLGFVSSPRMPRRKEHQTSEDYAELKAEFEKVRGKWGSIELEGLFNSKEEAARQLLAKQMKSADRSPLMQAAIRNDIAEVSRLLNSL